MRQKKMLFALLGLLALGLSGCDKLRARDNVNNGVRAFRDSNYAGAVEYFQQALDLDPELLNAELYLATAYSQQFVPGSPDPNNQRFAELAIETFESVLEREPTNVSAIAGLANIYQNTNRLDQAREYYLRQVELQPDDPAAHYSIGSINWTIVTERAPELAGLDDLAAEADEEEIAPEEQEARIAELRTLIEEGQQSLDRALELDPSYEDAMTYKNLLYRQAAELIPEDSEDEDALARREELIAMADEWFDRAMTTREENAQAAQSGVE